MDEMSDSDYAEYINSIQRIFVIDAADRALVRRHRFKACYNENFDKIK